MNSKPSKLERAKVLKDQALALNKKHGLWLPSSKPTLRFRGAEIGRFRIAMVTPFSGVPQRSAPLPADLPEALKHSAAVELQNMPVTPYWLDIWAGPKVFSVRWNDHGVFEILNFKRGDWEGEMETFHV